MGLRNTLNKLAIFFRIDRAGGVNKTSAGFEARDGIFENLALEFDEISDVRELDPPTGIDPAPQNARV